jgi:putative ABC transport system permease protein
MNIMLVTVTERTKEIGLLKAIGAKRKDILTQFLIEAVVLTLSGGAVGIVLGLSLGYMVAQLIHIPYVVSISSIALAVGVSTAVGVIFGIYPAQRAAKLSPIDALRYE